MGIPVNFDGVEAWSGGAVLSPGRHQVKVIEAEQKASQSGTPQIVVKLEATAGPEVGGTVTDWIAVTPKAMGRVRGIMEALKVPIPTGQAVLEPGSFVGHTGTITVAQEPGRSDPSKMFTVVTGYEATGQAPDPMAQAAAQAPGGDFVPSHTDDDIPF